jgi:hypothetical protein
MSPKIEFLKQVDVRKAWLKEDKNFTPWIADSEVASKLLAQCGIDYDGELEIAREVQVPGVKRKLDVLIKTSSGESIAVENQFSSLDHDHMTRALAYAVGLEVKAIIVIAESHRPEFVAVADYLNAAALAYQEKGIPIFLVSLELYESSVEGVYFPRFEVVAQPDEWKAAVFQTAHSSGEESSRATAIFNFHDQFLPEVRKVTGIFKNVKPSSGNWKAGSFGLGAVQIAYMVAKDVTTASIWIHTRSKEANSRGLAVLKRKQSEIEKLVKGEEMLFREQETSSVDISINGIGWGAESPEARTKLLSVLGALTDIAKLYESELRKALEGSSE